MRLNDTNSVCEFELGHLGYKRMPRHDSHLDNSCQRCTASQRSLHYAPIFRLLLKVAVKGTHQCDFLNFCGPLWGPTWGQTLPHSEGCRGQPVGTLNVCFLFGPPRPRPSREKGVHIRMCKLASLHYRIMTSLRKGQLRYQ